LYWQTLYLWGKRTDPLKSVQKLPLWQGVQFLDVDIVEFLETHICNENSKFKNLESPKDSTR